MPLRAPRVLRAALALLSLCGPLPGAVAMDSPATVSHCTPQAADAPVLYLRGGMNNWAALDEFAFTYSCDAYYLNVKLQGRQEFKVADEAWTPAASYGGIGGGAAVPEGGVLVLGRGPTMGNLNHAFAGEHTLRLAFVGGQPTLSVGPKSFPDRVRTPVTDPLALSLRHDSRALSDRSPFGAIAAGGSIRFALHADPGVDGVDLVIEKRRLEGNQDLLEYREAARIPLAWSKAEGAWTGSHAFADTGVYGYSFEARIGASTFLYQNNDDAVYWTREQGSNGLGDVAELPASRRSIRRYRMTVYAADFKVPDWAADAVYYYVFPERFRNGDAGNDPAPGVDRYQDKGVEFHARWTDTPFRPGSGDGSDPVFNNDFFGGDIAGIIEKLDYIAGLGANTLYMTPVFAAASNHKYDTADYTRIDPHFGSDEDFDRLAAEAGKRGLRVVLDASLNHTGSDSIYFDRFGKPGGQGAFAGGRINADSPYADWYRFDASQENPDLMYQGWVGVKDLPELNKASAGFRRFAYGAEDSIMKRWLARGASGWRMDVAPWVPDDFWREWRSAIKQQDPQAITIAESWFDSSKFFLGDSFDSTMNYIFRNAVLDYANGAKATDIYPSLDYLREVYPPQSLHALMNLLSSHDVARSLHVFGHRGANDPPETIERAKQRLRLAWLFQMAYPGAPALYYGDEVGVTGGEDPFNRATYPWPDRGGQPDAALLAQFTRLAAMRRQHPVLRHGLLSAPLHLDAHVIVLARTSPEALAITASNNADSARPVTVRLPSGTTATRFEDALSGEIVEARDGELDFTVPAMFGRVLIAR